MKLKLIKTKMVNLDLLSNYRIIFLIGFSPKYAYEPGNKALERAAKTWKNSEGEMVGIWKEDWGNQIGFKIKEFYPEIHYEVWRPDIRAERIYEHFFENGVINKSFPVQSKRFLSGMRIIRDYYSKPLEKLLEDYYQKNEKIILLLPASRKLLTLRLLRRFSMKFPILNMHFLNSESLLGKFKLSHNPFILFNNIVKSIQIQSHVRNFNNLMVAHKKFIRPIKDKFRNIDVYFNTVGTDLSFWKPIKSFEEARVQNNIPLDRKVILLSSRLEPNYQIEKVLKLVAQLKSYNPYFIFTSHGSPNYEAKLKKIVDKNKLNGYVNFTGYVKEEILRDLYIACDYFFMSSLYNAGPMSSFIAMLMEKPVITTNTGLAAEMLEEYDCGLLLDPLDQNSWIEEFVKIINDENEIKTIDPNITKMLFNWENRVNKWVSDFANIVERFERRKSKKINYKIITTTQ